MKKKDIAIMLSGIIGFIICIINSGNIDDSFALVIFYPLVYSMMAMPLLVMLKNKSCGGRLTVSIFLGIQWLRNVLLPVAASLGGYMSSANMVADNNSANLASILCLGELIVTSIACCCILRYSKKRINVKDKENIKYHLSGNPYIYVAFILFATVLFFLFGRGMYTFFKLSFTESRASSTDRNMILHTVIGYGMKFLFVLIYYYCYINYKRTERKVYFYIALVAALIDIGIISTEQESRFSIMYSFGTIALLLPRLFTDKRKILLRTTTIMAVSMIFIMTVYKAFNAYIIGSYTVAIERQIGRFGADDIASMININFYGVRNVALNIYTANSINLTYRTFFADLINNTFGINYLLRIDSSLTMQLYNLYIYGGRSSTGYLFSAIAYGYIYFGAVFAPFMAVINICIAVFVENRMYRLRAIDIYSIVTVIYVRLAMTMFACFPMSWNYVTRTVVIGSLVIGGVSLFSPRTFGRRLDS